MAVAAAAAEGEQKRVEGRIRGELLALWQQEKLLLLHFELDRRINTGDVGGCVGEWRKQGGKVAVRIQVGQGVLKGIRRQEGG